MSKEREVTYAVVHGIIKVPDAPQLGPTLNSTPTGTNKGVKMTLVDDEMRLEVEHQGRKTTVYVPKTNFSHYQIKE